MRRFQQHSGVKTATRDARIASALILTLWTTGATAAGLRVSPATVHLTTTKNRPATAHLTITNPTPDVQIFRVYPDSLTDSFSITPASFTLESGAHRYVAVQFIPTNAVSETLQTNLSITARPLADAKFSAASGVKVPFTATVTASRQDLLRPSAELTATLAALLVVAGLLYFRRLKKNREME